MSRAREGPKEFLNGFRGFLQSDGYGAYAQLGGGIEYLACWAHARREFHKSHLLQKLDKRPVEILDLIGQMYEVEKQAREKGLSPSERLAARQELSRPILDKIRERILALKGEADFLPASQLGRACNYTLKLWDRLELFLKHGELEIDNNQCENSIRPLAVGRNYAEIRIMPSSVAKSALGPRCTRPQCPGADGLQLSIISVLRGTGSADLSLGKRFSGCGEDGGRPRCVASSPDQPRRSHVWFQSFHVPATRRSVRAPLRTGEDAWPWCAG